MAQNIQNNKNVNPPLAKQMAKQSNGHKNQRLPEEEPFTPLPFQKSLNKNKFNDFDFYSQNNKSHTNSGYQNNGNFQGNYHRQNNSYQNNGYQNNGYRNKGYQNNDNSQSNYHRSNNSYQNNNYQNNNYQNNESELILSPSEMRERILNEKNIPITEEYINSIFERLGFDHRVKNLENFQRAMVH